MNIIMILKSSIAPKVVVISFLIMFLISIYFLIFNLNINPTHSLLAFIMMGISSGGILFVLNMKKSFVSPLEDMEISINSVINNLKTNSFDKPLSTQIHIKTNNDLILSIKNSFNELINRLTITLKKNYAAQHLQELQIAEKTDALSTTVNELTITKNIQSKMIDDIKAKNTNLMDYSLAVSHDLKEPLRGIKLLASLLQEDKTLDTNSLNYIEKILTRADHLLGMINGLLKVSKIGRVREEPVTINIKKIVKDVIELLNPPSNINIAVDDNIPDIYFGKLNFIQIIQNLVQNAIKLVILILLFMSTHVNMSKVGKCQ